MEQRQTITFPKPGRALKGVMAFLALLWVVMAVALNWVGMGPEVLGWFTGSSTQVFSGQVWRLLTAALIHSPNAPSHILFTLLGLYFLGCTLEERWGGRRMLFFLGATSTFAYLMQAIFGGLIGQLHQPVWFGGLGMVEAVAVAWALSARDRQVRLFFVLPVTGNMLLGFIFIMSVLNVIAVHAPPEGLVTPFGGMLGGYLFGETSPLRRFYLQWRFKQLQSQSEALRGASTTSARRRASGLRVIKGGADDDDSPPDKRWLN